jgi:Neurotransmitter-gated ion-channel ligand binding domain
MSKNNNIHALWLDINQYYFNYPKYFYKLVIMHCFRLKLTFSCMMDLFKFPLDDQICSMEIASFSKTTSELVLKWDETSPVRMYQGLKLPQFRIRSVKASHCKEEFHIGTCT